MQIKIYVYKKKDEPLFSIYSQDIMSIQMNYKLQKILIKIFTKVVIKNLKILPFQKIEQEKIRNGKMDANGIVVTSPINGVFTWKSINQSSSVSKGSLLYNWQILIISGLWLQFIKVI